MIKAGTKIRYSLHVHAVGEETPADVVVALNEQMGLGQVVTPGLGLGGGTEILQATDIRIAGESAKFGVTEARWGLFPLGGSTVRLQRQIPYTKAIEMLLIARPIPAREALDCGLIGRVVEV